MLPILAGGSTDSEVGRCRPVLPTDFIACVDVSTGIPRRRG
jgi:hypothetical protein